MTRDATEDMAPQLRLEAARPSSASISKVGHHGREAPAPGGPCLEQAHHSTKNYSTFKTDAMRQAEIRAKAHLRKRRIHNASVTLAGESEPLEGKGSHLYFLSDGDIKDVIAIVMDALRRSFMTSECPKRDVGSDASANFDDPTASGFEYGRDSITPRLSAAADPATTISLPKTVFSYANWGGRRLSVTESRLDSSTKTTIVSRGSVSEIVWAEHEASDVPGFRNALSPAGIFNDAISQHCLKCHSLSKCVRCQNTMEADRADSICRFASLLAPSTNAATNKRASRSTDDESNMTSFPELRPRHCTNEWLKPPVEIEQLLRNQSSDLYRRGVDAHSGLTPNSPQSLWGSPVSFPVPCDDSVFNKNAFFSARSYFQERRTTGSSVGDGRKHYLRGSIGSMSGCRRASAIPAANQSPWQSQGELFPQIVNKLRQNSQDCARREDVVQPRECGAWTPEPEILPPPEPSLAADARSRESIIRERTPKPPAADKSGIYEALTGSRMAKLKKGCKQCSEDNRPHVCKDDLGCRASLG